MRRDSAYFTVAGVRLDEEMARLGQLPVFADGPLASRRPELKVRRARKRPNRLGFAVPSEYRLSVTTYPGIRVGDVLETLTHELVHLHVGRAEEAHAWHGKTFKAVLARAMAEGYGIEGPSPRSTIHGVYAEAIELTDRRGRRPSGDATRPAGASHEPPAVRPSRRGLRQAQGRQEQTVASCQSVGRSATPNCSPPPLGLVDTPYQVLRDR